MREYLSTEKSPQVDRGLGYAARRGPSTSVQLFLDDPRTQPNALFMLDELIKGMLYRDVWYTPLCLAIPVSVNDPTPSGAVSTLHDESEATSVVPMSDVP